MSNQSLIHAAARIASLPSATSYAGFVPKSPLPVHRDFIDISIHTLLSKASCGTFCFDRGRFYSVPFWNRCTAQRDDGSIAQPSNEAQPRRLAGATDSPTLAFVRTEMPFRAILMLVRYQQVVRPRKTPGKYQSVPNHARGSDVANLSPLKCELLGEEGDTKRAIWLSHTNTTPLLL